MACCPFSSAELYDPTTGAWTFTGSLVNANDAHRAVLLNDGRVLIAGGGDSGGPRTLQTAELYDPVSGTWSATGSLSGPVKWHTLSLLPDGKVLRAAGDSASGILPSPEVYDPATGTWSTTASLNVARYVHTATLLPSGEVLVAGGYNLINSLASAELFGPSVVSVTIDIKPGSFPNSINLGSGGTVPVAILSTPAFDATTVDPTTVTLASAPARLKGKGTPMASSEDVNGDGLHDLVVHVSTDALELSGTDTEAVLEGGTFDGKAIRGADSVRIVPD